MNKVIMMGRLTKDPVIFNEGKRMVSKYSIACNRNRNNGEQTEFFECVTFGKSAEFSQKFLRQGTKVVISGELRNDSYVNREGIKVNKIVIQVFEQEFAESKSQQAPHQGYQAQYQEGRQAAYQEDQSPHQGGWQDSYQEDQSPYQGGQQDSYRAGKSSYQGSQQAQFQERAAHDWRQGLN